MAPKEAHCVSPPAGDLSRQAGLIRLHIPGTLGVCPSQVIFQLRNGPGWLLRNAMMFLALVMCHLSSDVGRFPGGFTS